MCFLDGVSALGGHWGSRSQWEPEESGSHPEKGAPWDERCCSCLFVEKDVQIEQQHHNDNINNICLLLPAQRLRLVLVLYFNERKTRQNFYFYFFAVATLFFFFPAVTAGEAAGRGGSL